MKTKEGKTITNQIFSGGGVCSILKTREGNYDQDCQMKSASSLR